MHRSKYDDFDRIEFHQALTTLVIRDDIPALAEAADVLPQILKDFYDSNSQQPGFLISPMGEKIIHALSFESFSAFYDEAAERNGQPLYSEIKREAEQKNHEAKEEKQRVLQEKQTTKQATQEEKQAKQERKEQAKQDALEAKQQMIERAKQRAEKTKIEDQEEKQRIKQAKEEALKEQPAPPATKRKPTIPSPLVCEKPFGQAVQRILDIQKIPLGKFVYALHFFQFDLKKKNQRSELLDLTSDPVKYYLQFEKDTPFGNDLRDLILSYYHVKNVDELKQFADKLEQEHMSMEKPGFVVESENGIRRDGKIANTAPAHSFSSSFKR